LVVALVVVVILDVFDIILFVVGVAAVFDIVLIRAVVARSLFLGGLYSFVSRRAY
jgi:hypothetical protein